MNDTIEVYGIVMKSQPVGEYDKRVTILTKERGKVSAFARGARRQGSALMGVTGIFATGRFRLREGRDSYNLYHAQIDNFFDPLLKDMEQTCYGTYFLELADYYAREQMSEPQMIKLLYLALTALTRESLPNRLVRRIFELRIMVIDGQYDSEPPANASDTCRYTWDFIIHTPCERLFTFVLKEEVFAELEAGVDRSLKKYVDRPMHSLEILESLNP